MRLAIVLSLIFLALFSGCTKVITKEIPVIVECKEPLPLQEYSKDMCDEQTFKTKTNTFYDAISKCIEYKFRAKEIDFINAMTALKKCKGEV